MGCLLLLVFIFPLCLRAQEEEFKKAKLKDTVRAYEDFIKTYPKSELRDIAIEAIINKLKDESPNVRATAVKALGNIRGKQAVKPLITCLKDENPIVRETATRALGEIKDEQNINALVWTIMMPTPFKNEPDGFRDIKWGTDILTLSGMKSIEKEDLGESYVKEEDRLYIGKAKVEKIIYGFYKGKFVSVLIYTKNKANFDALKDALFKKFGKATLSNEYTQKWNWYGKKTIISLIFQELPEDPTLLFGSIKGAWEGFSEALGSGSGSSKEKSKRKLIIKEISISR